MAESMILKMALALVLTLALALVPTLALAIPVTICSHHHRYLPNNHARNCFTRRVRGSWAPTSSDYATKSRRDSAQTPKYTA